MISHCVSGAGSKDAYGVDECSLWLVVSWQALDIYACVDLIYQGCRHEQNDFHFTVGSSAFGLLASDSELEKCHSMSTDYTRLMCYDKASGYVKLKADQPYAALTEAPNVEPEAEPLGKQWRYSDETSALDGRKDVWLSVTSKNTEGNSIGSPIRATFYVRCMENSTNVLIGFDRYTTDNQSVKYKLDDGSVQKQWMETMRGGDGIGVWSGARAIPFVKRIFGKDSLVISYNTYTGPVEFTFDVSGLRERIDPLATACQWKP